jgi:vacuolar protein sorting-associated protein IST1
MELKKKVTKDIAAENNILVDFSGIPEETEDILVDFSELQEVTDDGNSNVQELIDEMSCQDDMDGSSELEDDHQHSHRTNTSGLESDENVQVITNSDGSDDEIKGQRSRKWWHLGCT